MKKSIGFNLIELLVVVFIIGIVSSVIFLRNSNHNTFKQSQEVAEQLVMQIKNIREQSISQLKTLSLMINKNNYIFYQYNERNKKDDVLKKYNVPAGIQLKVAADEAIIIFSPDGEVTPFRITIYNKSTTRLLQIMGYSDGRTESREIM